SEENEYQVARVVKPSSELEKMSTIQRLEILRRYFFVRGIEFGIVTEKDINMQFARNIAWTLSAYELDDYPELHANYDFIRGDMLNYLSDSNQSFQSVFSIVERSYGLKEGLALVLFKHLVATKQIKMDLNNKIELQKKCKEYGLTVPS